MLDKLKLVLSLVAATVALTSAAFAQSTTDRRESYAVGAPVMSYGNFPFPKIAPGEIWIPDLTWQSATTIVYDSYKEQNEIHLPKTKLTLDEYKKQGRLNEVLPIYDRHAKTSPWGIAELKIGEAYNYGQGGLEKSESKALEWYKRGAMEKPIIYYLMGEIYRNSKDPAVKNDALAAHYYSTGAARGCGRCAQRMIHMIAENEKYPTVTFPADAQLRYQLYLFDLGYAYSDKWLEDYLDAYKRGPEVTAFNVKMFGSKDPPSLETGELAEVLHKRIRTGFMPSACLRAKKAIDANKMDSAFNTMTSQFWGCHGRFRGQLLAQLVAASSREGEDVLTGAIPFYFGQEALKAGEMSFALLAAMAYAENRTASGYGKNFKVKTLTPSSGMARYLTKPAVQRGLVLQSDANMVIGSALVLEAKKCWWGALSARTGSTVQHESRENIERVMAKAARDRCFDKEEESIRLTGDPDIMADFSYVQRIKVKGRQYAAERMAKIERQRQRAAANRASFRSSPSRPTSYIAKGSTGSVPGTLSSSEAYSASKKAVCASSTTKTSFCR
ncbi:MAG: hypothetical protein AB8B54_10855 [Sphingorhabdus sp.]